MPRSKTQQRGKVSEALGKVIRYLGLMTYVEEPWLLPDDFSLLVLIHEAVMERRAEIPDRLFEFLDWKIAHKEW